MTSEFLLVTRLFSVLLDVPKIRQTGKNDKNAEEGVIIIGDICICPAKSTKKTLKGIVETNVWEVYDETGEMLGEQHTYIDNAAIAALQHYVKGAAKGMLDEMACEGAAAWFEEERVMLKTAYKEGLDASNASANVSEPPYPYGTDFHKEWVKGFKAGKELHELCKPY